MDWIDALFSGSGFMPHGFCYTWDPRVIWLNAASDTGIALAYYAIPVLLVYLVRQRKDLAFHYIFLLFALFILACGTTHMLEVISIWHPVYWLAGVTKAATAAVSILTTMALVPLVPKILALPSPEALQQANRELQGAQGALQEINATLEARIAERVASLAEANAALRNEIDERKRTDDRLRASEAQFRLAISSSPIPSMIWDAAGAVRLVSQGWTDCSGYALEDLPTLSDWMQKAYGEEKEAADLYIAAHFAGTETTHDGERAIQAKDGGERTWDFYTTPLGPDQAGFRLFISRAFDITDRRRAEAAQAQLAAIVTGSDDAILSKSMDGTLTTWNEGAERMFGYTAGEMIGQPVARLLPPDRLDEEKQILARLERGEHVGHYETVRQGKDGRLIEVSLSISPLQDGHGQVIGASKIARDITARKRTERALQESEARFRTMANSIPQLAWMTRPDGYIVWYNRRWFDYTGTTPEEMEGWGWQRVHDPDVLPAVMKQWQGAIAAGVPWEMEFPLRAADGRYRMFLTRVTPLKDVEGRILQWFGTNTDISDRLEAE
ncbi:MAG TPA: PAS domain S-box protein, partial [Chthoniobacterales bacterium]